MHLGKAFFVTLRQQVLCQVADERSSRTKKVLSVEQYFASSIKPWKSLKSVLIGVIRYICIRFLLYFSASLYLLRLDSCIAADDITKLRVDAILIVVAFAKQLRPLAEDTLGSSMLKHKEEIIKIIENGSHQR